MARGYLTGLIYYLFLLSAAIPAARAKAEAYIVKGQVIEVQLVPAILTWTNIKAPESK